MERGKMNILAATLHKIKAINGTLQRDEEINKKEKTREEGNKQKIIEMKKRIWRNECTYSAQMPLNSLLRMLQNAHTFYDYSSTHLRWVCESIVWHPPSHSSVAIFLFRSAAVLPFLLFTHRPSPSRTPLSAGMCVCSACHHRRYYFIHIHIFT